MDFSYKIIEWYNVNKRDLPWRNTKNPYYVWISEIILQQTRVSQGLPYYNKFVENFPTIKDLAEASENNVLKLWQGLGYYSRGRNLHFSAQYIQNNLKGEFPSTFNELKKLKGVGNYTAAAIASFCYDEKVAVVDGNVIRVLSRFFGVNDDVSLAKTINKINDLANKVMPVNKVNIYNQAIMEFGALQCKPKSPNCTQCPLLDNCVAYDTNRVNVIPYKSKKIKIKKRYFNYLVFKSKNSIYFKQRSEKDIWQNLFDFPLLETHQFLHFNDKLFLNFLHKFIHFKNVDISISEDYVHILSHQIINARFFIIEFNNDDDFNNNEVTRFNVNQLNDIGKPILIQNFLKKYIL